MSEILYSFIVPHKNTPDLLNRCINSIPSREDIQIIVVDDNSEFDKKPNINREGVEVVLLDVQHSNGAGHARNVGLQHARGKWRLFADSDDFYCSGFVDILDLYSESRIDILFFNFHYIDGKSGVDLPPLSFQKYLVEFDGSASACEKVKYLHNVPWTKMVSRDYLNRYGFYFEEVPNGNDVFFSMSIGYFTNSICVEKRPLYVYVKNDNSILTSKRTVTGEMCRLEHLIKQNYFYRFLGHKDWEKPVLKGILQRIKVLGVPFLGKLIKASGHLYHNREEWATIIPEMRNYKSTKE